MSTWLIGIVTFIYAGVAIDYGIRGNAGMCVVFAGYAVANIGLIYASR